MAGPYGYSQGVLTIAGTTIGQIDDVEISPSLRTKTCRGMGFGAFPFSVKELGRGGQIRIKRTYTTKAQYDQFKNATYSDVVAIVLTLTAADGTTNVISTSGKITSYNLKHLGTKGPFVEDLVIDLTAAMTMT